MSAPNCVEPWAQLGRPGDLGEAACIASEPPKDVLAAAIARLPRDDDGVDDGVAPPGKRHDLVERVLARVVAAVADDDEPALLERRLLKGLQPCHGPS